MSGNTTGPMSAEKRAAMEKRLAELKAMQTQATPAPTGWQPQQQQQQRYEQRQYQNQYAYSEPVAQYGYDDEEEEIDSEDDFDAGREAFFDEMERLHFGHQNHADPVHGANNFASAPLQRVVGDFEVLRLAKMGDAQSCFEFADMTGVDLKTFLDNKECNVLHYAADSGNVAFVKALLSRGVAFKADMLGITPLDIAILNSGDSAAAAQPPQSSELIDVLLAEAAKVSTLSVDQKRLRTVEELCRTFAPKPPGFVMSKPAPPAPISTCERFFWSASKAAPTAADAEGVTSGVASAVAGEDVSADGLADRVAQLCDSPASHESRSAWLLPVEAGLVQSAWQSALRLTLHRSEPHAAAAAGGVDGVIMSLMAGGELRGFSPKLNTYKAKNVACVSVLAVAPSQRGLGLAARMMQCAQRDLQDAGVEAVVFAAPELLPSPPAMVSMVKWLRRVVEPTHVFRDQAYAEGVFPEFFQDDQSLRAQAVLKGHVPETLFEARRAELMGWSAVNPEDDIQVELVLQFLRAHAGTATGVELAYVPETADDLRHGLLMQGVFPYVRVVGEDVKDFVVLRRRMPCASELREASAVFDLVYGAFAALKGVDKSEHVLLLAQRLHHADVVYVPTMFSFLDSDLVKAHFEEDAKQRQFLYVCNPNKGPVASAVPATPAAKVALPVFIL